MRTNLWKKLWCGTCMATILLAGRSTVLLAGGTVSPLYGPSLDNARKHIQNPNVYAPGTFKSSLKYSSALKATGDSTRVKLSKTAAGKLAAADKLAKSKSKISKAGQQAAHLSLNKEVVAKVKLATEPATLDKLNVPQLSPALNPKKPILQPLVPVVPPSSLPILPPIHPLFPPISLPQPPAPPAPPANPPQPPMVWPPIYGPFGGIVPVPYPVFGGVYGDGFVGGTIVTSFPIDAAPAPQVVVIDAGQTDAGDAAAAAPAAADLNEPPTPDDVKQIVIVNPQESKTAVRFLLNGQWKGLAAGRQLELNTAEALTVEFDGNTDLGRASYRLSEGTYTFNRNDDGWQLFRTPAVDATAAE